MSGFVWIDITEDSPDLGEQVFVRTRFGVGVDEWVEHRDQPVSWSTATVTDYIGWRENEMEDVSHWARVPQLPEFKEFL